jgi:hypothetical protein
VKNTNQQQIQKLHTSCIVGNSIFPEFCERFLKEKNLHPASESRDQRILKIFLSLLRISSHKEGSAALGKKSPDTGCHKAGENPLSQKKLIHKYCTQMQESCEHGGELGIYQ